MNALANLLVQHDVGVLALSVALQCTIVLGAALLVARLLKHNPAARACILTTGMVAALMCPFVTAVMKCFGVSFVSVPLASSVGNLGPEFAAMLSMDELAGVETELSVGEDDLAAAPDTLDSEAVPSGIESTQGGRVVSGVSASESSAERNRAFGRWALLGLAVWLSGAVVSSIGIGRSWWTLRKVLGSTQPIESESLRDAVSEVQRILRTRTFPPVLSSSRVSCPAVAGVLRPVIVLPAGFFGKLSRKELSSVLLHEAAHVVRRDQLVLVLQQLLGAVFWPHPFVYLLNRDLTRAREEVCDNYVLQSVDARRYVGTLLRLAKLLPQSRPAATGFSHLGARWNLEERASGLLHERRRTIVRMSAWGALASVAVMGLLVVAGSGIRVMAQPQSDESAVERPAKESDASGRGATVAWFSKAEPPGSGEPDYHSSERAIRGVWSVVSTAGGRGVAVDADAFKDFKLFVSEKEIARCGAGKALSESVYVVDWSKKPATIDIWETHELALGIVEVSGDQLKLCLRGPGADRPKSFDPESFSPDALLMILQRERIITSPLFIMNADGSGSRQLLDMPEYTVIGSPSWSADGRRIAFDAFRAPRGEDHTKTHVFTVNADGSSVKDLGPGAMPSWSPDGTQIAFSKHRPYLGVWMMNADGSGRKQIDVEGWAAEWCPTGEKIAYTKYSRGADWRSKDLCVYDVKSGQRRTLLDPGYDHVYWGLCWSPDGQYLCFLGSRDDGTREVAVVHVKGQQEGFRVLTADLPAKAVRSIKPCFAWGGDGSQVLVSMKMPNDRQPQLYVLDAEAKLPPQRLSGQDPDRANVNMAWSPDGKQIAFCSRPARPRTVGM